MKKDIYLIIFRISLDSWDVISIDNIYDIDSVMDYIAPTQQQGFQAQGTYGNVFIIRNGRTIDPENIEIEKLISTYEQEYKDNIRDIIDSDYSIEDIILDMGKRFGITKCLKEKHEEYTLDGHSSNVAWILCAVELDLV